MLKQPDLLPTPSPDSEIGLEVWLPEKWNGRYQQLGNGGWAGSIFYQQMGPSLTHGFVVAAGAE